MTRSNGMQIICFVISLNVLNIVTLKISSAIFNNDSSITLTPFNLLFISNVNSMCT